MIGVAKRLFDIVELISLCIEVSNPEPKQTKRTLDASNNRKMAINNRQGPFLPALGLVQELRHTGRSISCRVLSERAPSLHPKASATAHRHRGASLYVALPLSSEFSLVI